MPETKPVTDVARATGASAQIDPPRATLADREAREYGIEPLDAATAAQFGRLGADSAVAAARGTLRALGPVPVKRCKACGGGAAYLEKHPELDYCTPQCEAYGAVKVPTIHISSVLDIPLGVRAPIAAALLENATVPALAEDRAASAMFDGDEPPADEPVVDVADYVSGLERDAQAAHLELQRVTAENSALRTQLIAALDRVRELEALKGAP